LSSSVKKREMQTIKSNSRFSGDEQKTSPFEKKISDLYFSYFEDLLNYGLKLTNDKAIVEDAIQEIFVDLLRNEKKYSTIEHPRFYLIKSIKYLIIKELTKRSANVDLSELSKNTESITQPVEDQIIELEGATRKREIMMETLNELSPKEKESVYLKYIGGLDYPEISEIMQIKIETVRTMVYRALKKIRKLNDQNNLQKKIYLLFALLSEKNIKSF